LIVYCIVDNVTISKDVIDQLRVTKGALSCDQTMYFGTIGIRDLKFSCKQR